MTDGARFSNPFLRVAAACMLMLCATAYAWTADLGGIAATEFLFGVLVLLKRRPLKWSFRSFFYTALAAAAASVAENFYFPLKINNFGYFSILFQPEYYLSGALYFAMLFLLFDKPRHWAGVLAWVYFLTLCTTGDIINFRRENSFFPWNANWLRQNYFICYNACALAGLLGVAFTAYRSSARRKTCRPAQIIRLAAILILLPLGWKFCWDFYRGHERDMRAFERFVMSFSRNLARHGTGSKTPDSFRLGQGLPPDGPEAEEILLRAEGEKAPGYLRKKVYTRYFETAWHAAAERRNALDAVELPGVSTLRFQASSEAARPDESWQFQAANPAVCNPLPLPGNWTEIDLLASGVSCDTSGGLHPEKLQIGGGWRVGALKTADGDTAYQLPRKPDAALLQIPEELLPVLDRTLARIQGMAETKTDAQKMHCIAFYLLENFTYRIRTEDTPGEPVADFLTQNPSGHCEFFASAAVLLARRAGLPARYVTGYVCMERAPFGNYFVARRGSAHAWAEVFDRDAQRWRTLETTPPDGRPAVQKTWRFISGVRDNLARLWGDFSGAMRRGDAAVFLKNILLSPPLCLLAALVALFFALRKWRAVRGRKRPSAVILSPEEKALKKRALRWERRVRRRTGEKDCAGLTMPEIAGIAETSKRFSAQEKAELKAFIREYEARRWRP